MRRIAHKPLVLAGVALLAVAFAAVACPAMAEEGAPPPSREEVLDRLFANLATAEDETSADIAVASIWRIWLDSGSDTIDLLTERAIEAMEVEELETALQILDEVVELAPDYPEGWNKRATVHFLMRHYDASIHDVQRALALEPRHFGAMSGLGAMLRETGRTDAALAIYRKAIELNPHLKGARDAVDDLVLEVEGREI